MKTTYSARISRLRSPLALLQKTFNREKMR